MPETATQWAALVALAYFWTGQAFVAEAFKAPVFERPIYAMKGGGPILFFYMWVQPIFSLLKNPFLSFFVLAVHLFLVLLGFWIMGLLQVDGWIRLAILLGLIMLMAIPFLVRVGRQP